MENIIKYLFETNAIRICQENKPFWYTSGKIGPYFINTHFIYGSEKEAEDFLEFINKALENKEDLPKKVFEKVLEQYNQNEIYKNVINEMKKHLENNINTNEVDCISGGERRDWFFSNILAYLLKKPHITIFKDLSILESDSDFKKTNKPQNLNGKKVLHIADLITVASSYLRAWIPAIEKNGGEMIYSCSVVDRRQGGKQKLEEKGIKLLSLVNIDKKLFEKAFNMNIISDAQKQMLEKYLNNPEDTMCEFLINHPEFLEQSLNSDEKTKKRAKLLIEQNWYNE